MVSLHPFFFPLHLLLPSLLPATPLRLLATVRAAGEKSGIYHCSRQELAASSTSFASPSSSTLVIASPRPACKRVMEDGEPPTPTHHPSMHPAFLAQTLPGLVQQMSHSCWFLQLLYPNTPSLASKCRSVVAGVSRQTAHICPDTHTYTPCPPLAPHPAQYSNSWLPANQRYFMVAPKETVCLRLY